MSLLHPSYFHHQSVTVFLKSVSTLTLSPLKPPTNQIAKNTSTLFARM